MATKEEIFKALDPLLEMEPLITWDSKNHLILNSSNPDPKELNSLYKDLSTRLFRSNFDIAKDAGIGLKDIVNGDIDSYTEYDRLLVHHLTNQGVKNIDKYFVLRGIECFWITLEINDPRCFLVTDVIQGKLGELARDESTSIYRLTSEAIPNLEKIQLSLSNITLTHLVKPKSHKVTVRMSFLPYKVFK